MGLALEGGCRRQTLTGPFNLYELPRIILYAYIVALRFFSTKVQSLREMSFQDYYCVEFHIDTVDVKSY